MKLGSLVLCFIYVGHCLDMKHLRSRSLDHKKMQNTKHFRSKSLDHEKRSKSFTIQAELEKLKTPSFQTRTVLIGGHKAHDRNFSSVEPVKLNFFLENSLDMNKAKPFDVKEKHEDYDPEHNFLSVNGRCRRLEWDQQGCVSCLRDAKCRSGWSYHSYQNCGFLNWSCESKCYQDYDWPCGNCGQACPTPAPTFSPWVPPKEPPIQRDGPVFIINEKNGLVLTYIDGLVKMQFIDSAMDITNNKLPEDHPQLFRIDGTTIWFGNTAVLSDFRYNKVSRTFTTGKIEKLCIDNHDLRNGSLLSTCVNCDGTTIYWKLKSHKEAFPHDHGIIEEYYIASKQSDLILEKRGDIGSLEGFPLYLWVPQDLPGQLWHSDSYGRILSRNNWYVESSNVLTFCYILPSGVKADDNVEIMVYKEQNEDGSPNMKGPYVIVKFIVTHELWMLRGKRVCQVDVEHPVEPGTHITTTATREEGGHQQWVLHDNKLENGYDRKLLTLVKVNSHGENNQIGMPTELKDKSEDRVYLVPRELTTTWIDMVATKRSSSNLGSIVKNPIIKELLFYQKTAAFHLSTVIGLSPEELITRSYVMKQGALEAVKELKKSNKNYAISQIVHGSVSIVATGFEILGYALAGPTMGTSIFFAALGRLLSLSNNSVKKINGFYKKHTVDIVEGQDILGEIQRSVLTGGYALASFLDDYVEVLNRYDTFKNSDNGKEAIEQMKVDADLLAQKIGYSDFDALKDDLIVKGSALFADSFYSAAKPLVEYAMYDGFDKTVFYEKYTGIDLSSNGYTSNLWTKGMWAFSVGKGTYDIVANAQRLGKDQNTKIGDAIINNIEFLEKTLPVMYSQMSELIGDAEDLMFLEAAAEKMGEQIDFTNNQWRELKDKGNGNMESTIYGSLYNVLWEVQ